MPSKASLPPSDCGTVPPHASPEPAGHAGKLSPYDDREGLDRISEVVAARLRALGGKVELIEPGAEIYRMSDTPERIGRMVRGTFAGTGSRRILLLAHMDTVYPRGMLAQQPFKVDPSPSQKPWPLASPQTSFGRRSSWRPLGGFAASRSRNR